MLARSLSAGRSSAVPSIILRCQWFCCVVGVLYRHDGLAVMVFTVRTRRAGVKGHASQTQWSWPRILLVLVLCSSTFFLGHHHGSGSAHPIGSTVALRDAAAGEPGNRTDALHRSGASLRATRALLEKERQEAKHEMAGAGG